MQILNNLNFYVNAHMHAHTHNRHLDQDIVYFQHPKKLPYSSSWSVPTAFLPYPPSPGIPYFEFYYVTVMKFACVWIQGAHPVWLLLCLAFFTHQYLCSSVSLPAIVVLSLLLSNFPLYGYTTLETWLFVHCWLSQIKLPWLSLYKSFIGHRPSFFLGIF